MKKKIIYIAFFAFIFCAFASCEPLNLRTKNILFRQSFMQNEIKGINVDITSETLQIDTWNKDSIQVVMYGTSDFPNTALKNSVLTITTPRGNYHPRDCIVQIIVPESFCANAGFGGWKIESSSGSIIGTLLWGETMTIKSASGTIELAKCEAKTATISTSSGSISVDDCSFSNQASVTSTSGSVYFSGKTSAINVKTISGGMNVKLLNPLTEKSTFESISGTIVLALPKASNFKLNFETTSGSVYNAFNNYVGGKSGNDIVGNGIPLIRVKTVSGSIQVIPN